MGNRVLERRQKILHMDQLLECSDEVSKSRQLWVGVDNCALAFENVEEVRMHWANIEICLPRIEG